MGMRKFLWGGNEVLGTDGDRVWWEFLGMRTVYFTRN